MYFCVSVRVLLLKTQKDTVSYGQLEMHSHFCSKIEIGNP